MGAAKLADPAALSSDRAPQVIVHRARKLEGVAEADGVSGRSGLSILTRRGGAAEEGAKFCGSLRFR